MPLSPPPAPESGGGGPDRVPWRLRTRRATRTFFFFLLFSARTAGISAMSLDAEPTWPGTHFDERPPTRPRAARAVLHHGRHLLPRQHQLPDDELAQGAVSDPFAFAVLPLVADSWGADGSGRRKRGGGGADRPAFCFAVAAAACARASPSSLSLCPRRCVARTSREEARLDRASFSLQSWGGRGGGKHGVRGARGGVQARGPGFPPDHHPAPPWEKVLRAPLARKVTRS